VGDDDKVAQAFDAAAPRHYGVFICIKGAVGQYVPPAAGQTGASTSAGVHRAPAASGAGRAGAGAGAGGGGRGRSPAEMAMELQLLRTAARLECCDGGGPKTHLGAAYAHAARAGQGGLRVSAGLVTISQDGLASPIQKLRSILPADVEDVDIAVGPDATGGVAVWGPGVAQDERVCRAEEELWCVSITSVTGQVGAGSGGSTQGWGAHRGGPITMKSVVTLFWAPHAALDSPSRCLISLWPPDLAQAC
jgi:hypothetical protein